MRDETVRRLLALAPHAVITQASAPTSCRVCQGDRVIDVQRPQTPPPPGDTLPCLHCWAGMALVDLPMRTDTPRGDAA